MADTPGLVVYVANFPYAPHKPNDLIEREIDRLAAEGFTSIDGIFPDSRGTSFFASMPHRLRGNFHGCIVDGDERIESTLYGFGPICSEKGDRGLHWSMPGGLAFSLEHRSSMRALRQLSEYFDGEVEEAPDEISPRPLWGIHLASSSAIFAETLKYRALAALKRDDLESHELYPGAQGSVFAGNITYRTMRTYLGRTSSPEPSTERLFIRDGRQFRVIDGGNE